MEQFIQFVNDQNVINNRNVNIELLELLVNNIDDSIQIVRENISTEPEIKIASKEFIESLTEIENDKEDLSCSICLEEFKIGEKCIKLPCKDHPHYFHKGNDKCPGIMEWFKKSNTCPVCRSEFPCEENNPIIEEAEVVNEQDEQNDEQQDEQNDEQQDEVGVETILEQDLVNHINRVAFVRFINMSRNNLIEQEEQRQLDAAIQSSLEEQ